MQVPSGKRVSSIERAFRDAVRRVLLVIDELSDSSTLTDRLDDLRALVDALPLAPDELCKAQQRIRNTYRYSAAGERGAAVYELKALLHGLSAWAHESGFHGIAPVMSA